MSQGSRVSGHARRAGAAAVACGLAWAAVGGFAGGLWGLAGSPAYAAGSPSCSDTSADPSSLGPVKKNPTAAQLDIGDFQQAVLAAGAPGVGGGVAVAVVDSGVDTKAHLPLVPGTTFRVPDAATPVQDTDGTTVAGIIAGAPVPGGGPVVGIAPAARIVDVHVWDTTAAPAPGATPTDGEGVTLSPATVLVGLQHLASADLRGAGVGVVLVPLQVAGSTELRAAMQQITAQGVVVVAPSGDRPSSESTGADGFPSDFAKLKRGEDAASTVYPAGYSLDPAMKGLVVAVGTTVPSSVSPSSIALFNSATDVAAPSAHAVSYDVTAQPCLVDDPSTHIAAAQVAGVLAGMLSVPGMTGKIAVERLEATASGLTDRPGVPTDRLIGQGVIQPVEAVTRPLAFDRYGNLIESTTPAIRAEPVALPTKEPDVLRSTRHHALWWGLGGGAALLIAVMLRPVLARRRV